MNDAQTMQVLRYVEPGRVDLQQAPTPEIGEGELLLRVDVCGICATDVKTFLKGHARIEAGRVLGHEIVGTVAQSRTPEWGVGQQVTVAPYVPCLDCAWCARGQYTLCENLFRDRAQPGGFAEYVRLPSPIVERGVFAIPEGMEPEAAAFAEPLGCSLHGLRKLSSEPGQSLLVIGDGTMGLLQAGLGRAIGLEPVMVSGVTDSRLAFAERLADVVIDARTEDVASVAARHTAGQGPDNVMVSVPLEEAIATGLAAVRRGGTLNLFAGFPKGSTPPVDVNRIHYQEMTVVGSFGFTPRDIGDALELAVRAELPIIDMVTRKVALSEAEQAMRAAGEWRGLKTLVLPAAES